MRTDYKIGIAVALLLAVGLVVYFVATDSNDPTTEDNEPDNKVKSGERNLVEQPDPAGSGFVQPKVNNLVAKAPKVADPSKDENLVPKTTATFTLPKITGKTYGSRAVLEPDDETERLTGRTTPSFSGRTTGTTGLRTISRPRFTKPTTDSSTSSTTSTGKMRYHTVVEADNFWVIADKYYGHGKYWTLIKDANPGVDSTKLRPGDVLKIPPLPKTPVRPSLVTRSTPGTLTRSISGSSIYTVKSGDSYWKIAKDQYGNGSLYLVIQQANKDIAPEDLKPGQKITIPPKPIKKVATPSPRTTSRTLERSPAPPEPIGPEVVTNDKGEVFD